MLNSQKSFLLIFTRCLGMGYSSSHIDSYLIEQVPATGGDRWVPIRTLGPHWLCMALKHNAQRTKHLSERRTDMLLNKGPYKEPRTQPSHRVCAQNHRLLQTPAHVKPQPPPPREWGAALWLSPLMWGELQPPSHWKVKKWMTPLGWQVKKKAVAHWCASVGSKGVGLMFKEGSQKRQKPKHNTSVQSPTAIKNPSGIWPDLKMWII